MAGVSGSVTAAPDEWLAAISGPVSLVVERLGVPHSLQKDLWDLDGVGAWALAAALERAGLGVGNVVTVIRAVQVLAVPACGEAVVRHDTSRAGLGGEVYSLWLAGSLVLHADVGQLTEFTGLITGPVADVTDEHAETGLEGRNG